MIIGRRIVLRPVLQSDYPRLHAIENDPATMATWRYRGQMPTPAEYESALWLHTAQIMVVESKRTGEVIGYTQLHDLDLRAGHAYFSIYSGPDHRGSGLVMEGTMAFCEWAFTNWPIRWLYAHCFPQNLRNFESSIRRGETVHLGTLHERMCIDGEFTDVHVVGMERDTWLGGETSRRFNALRPHD
ncbi:MAG: GNAT family N-acetyltransferase [Actinomycetota bacterium]